jgi:hypothetical protein
MRERRQKVIKVLEITLHDGLKSIISLSVAQRHPIHNNIRMVGGCKTTLYL